MYGDRAVNAYDCLCSSHFKDGGKTKDPYISFFNRNNESDTISCVSMYTESDNVRKNQNGTAHTVNLQCCCSKRTMWE